MTWRLKTKTQKEGIKTQPFKAQSHTQALRWPCTGLVFDHIGELWLPDH